MIILRENPLKSLDQIHADTKLKEDTLQKVMGKQQQPKYARKIILSFCVMLVVFGIGYFTQSNLITETEKEYSYIAIDINPSIEMILNEKDVIVNVKAYNEDAKAIINDLSLKDKSYEEGMKEIINGLQQENYLSAESFLQVSVFSQDNQRMKQLEESITNFLNDEVSTPHGCMHVDESTHENAQSHHMSFGRYDLIQEIQSIDPKYAIEELNELTMYELRDIYYNLTNDEWNSDGHGGHGNRHGSGNGQENGHCY